MDTDKNLMSPDGSRKTRKRRSGPPAKSRVLPTPLPSGSWGVNFMAPVWLVTLVWFMASIFWTGAVWYFLSRRDPQTALWVACVGTILVLLAITSHLNNGIVDKREAAKRPVYFGEILPANEPTPISVGQLEKGSVALVLGGNTIITNNKTVALTVGGQPFLSVRVQNGSLFLSARLVNSNNQPVVRIIDNEFQASPERTFNPRQPDRSSLLVRDENGQEILNVRFINPQVIRINGIFEIPGQNASIIARDDALVLPGNNVLIGNRIVGSGTAIAIR